MPEMTMADYSAIVALSEENKRLRQRVAELERVIDKANIIALEKDAERYRWLRGLGVGRSNDFYHLSWQQDYDDDYIDAAIDAAMADD